MEYQGWGTGGSLARNHLRGFLRKTPATPSPRKMPEHRECPGMMRPHPDEPQHVVYHYPLILSLLFYTILNESLVAGGGHFPFPGFPAAPFSTPVRR
jgi:hypothetical protein